ncbi:MAG TPA: dihydroorotate dehydrogenase electron transfer subunit, partial [Limnochordia bacterium]|nr:dihydroorotate dehydrogenase electron transfer subunit [Limnochordia bacterium]
MTDPAFVTAQVLENRTVARDHFVLAVGLPPGWSEPAPGQFVDLGCRDPRTPGHDPLLLRPFSVYRAQGDRLELLIRIVGAGTALLARARPGDELPLLGPLGRGFQVRPGRIALVGGGVGVPPLVYLGERLRAAGGEALAMIGFQSADLAVCAHDFAALDIACRLATEDGSLGHEGRVTA